MLFEYQTSIHHHSLCQMKFCIGKKTFPRCTVAACTYTECNLCTFNFRIEVNTDVHVIFHVSILKDPSWYDRYRYTTYYVRVELCADNMLVLGDERTWLQSIFSYPSFRVPYTSLYSIEVSHRSSTILRLGPYCLLMLCHWHVYLPQYAMNDHKILYL